MKRVLAALAALLIAGPAAATTWYLAPWGDDVVNSGTSSTSPYKTMAKINAVVDTTDAVMMLGGQYPMPAPTNSAHMTASKRISYYGSQSNPALVTINVNLGGLSTSFLTIQGVTFYNGFGVTAKVDRDSFANCIMDQGFSPTGLKHSVISDCTIYANAIAWCNNANFSVAVADSFIRCTFNGLGYNYNSPSGSGGNAIVYMGQYDGSIGPTSIGQVDSEFVNRCTFNFHLTQCNQPGQPPIVMHYVTRSKIQYSNFHMTADCDQYSPGILLRDSCNAVTFSVDTLIWDGSNPPKDGVEFGSGGISNSMANLKFDSCLVVHEYNPAFAYQNQVKVLTITNSVVVSGASRAFNYSGNNAMWGRSVIDHDTFVGTGSPFGYPAGANWQDSTIITNNIFYSTTGKGQNLNTPNADPNNREGAIFASPAWFDSAAFVASPTTHALHLRSNNNLFAYYGYQDTVGDHAVMTNVACCGYNKSAIGTAHAWNAQFKADSNSVYGSPQFGQGSADSLPVFVNNLFDHFNAKLGVNSAAIGKGINGSTDIGAIASVAGTGQCSVFPRERVFYPHAAGDTASTTFTISNVGTGTLTVKHITFDTGEITADRDTASIAAGKSRKIVISYTAGSNMVYIANMTVNTSDVVTPLLLTPISISGTGGGDDCPGCGIKLH